LDEGAQYRLAGIAFKNNKAIINFAFLRGLFPIQDGDIFNSARVGEGLEELNRAYGRVGYINFTSFPQIRVDEAHGTIWLDIDFDEGKQFFVSSINVTGLDENVSQDLLSGFLLKPGDVFNKMLLELSMKRLPTQPSSEFVSYGLSRDEKVGTVGIEINFRSCSHIE
jgi:outer membrane protein insertion porin family